MRSGDLGSPELVSSLMNDLRRGDSDAAEALVQVFYDQLRRLAASKMRNERAAHTWQPTALVNELYLELLKIRELKSSAEENSRKDKAAFFNLAAHIMHRLLLSHVRPLAYRSERVELSSNVDSTEIDTDLLNIEMLLDRLGSIDPNLRRVVELKVFEGLTSEEAAAQMNCSVRSIARYWKFAQGWLAGALRAEPQVASGAGHAAF